MILFTILAVTAIMLLAIALFLITTGGALFITVFGDIIVCVGFIVLIMRCLIKRRKKKRKGSSK